MRQKESAGALAPAPDPALLDGLPVACVLLDRELTIAHINPAAEELFGYANDEVKGRSPRDLIIAGAQWENSERRFRYLAQGGVVAVGRAENRHKNGRRLVCEWHNSAVRDGRGRFDGVLGIALDVTSSAHEHDVLGRREAQLRRLLDNIPEVVWTAREDGVPQFLSGAFTTTLGYTPEEALAGGAALWFDSIHPDDRDRVRAAWRELFTGRRPFREEYRIRHKDGHWIWWYDRAVEVYERDGIRYADGLLSDITDQKRAEAELRASEDRYRLLFEANPLPLWVFDRETLRFLAVNDAAIAHYGYTRDEFLAMTLRDIRPPEDVEALEEQLHLFGAAGEGRSRWRHLRKNGDILFVEIVDHPIEYAGRQASLVAVNDITHEMRLEDQLRQAQKMEAIGQLTGGIAHDLNNVLTAVIAHADLAAAAAGDGARELKDDLAQAREAAHRGADLIRKLLAFSRRERLHLKPMALAPFIAEALATFRPLLPATIRLLTVLEDGQPIEGDQTAIQQIFLNLLTNARDAMPEGGTLRITVGQADVSDAPVAGQGRGRAGRYARLTVEDSGSGMPPEVRERMFEPFFTTKPPGFGTGLGMSMVYGLSKQHRGFVTVDSAPGEGTRVHVYFPLAERRVRPRVTPVQPATGSETVMVVEDEDPIRHAATRVLERNGYRVLAAADGIEALDRIRGGERVDLVISDAIMPRMGGLALYEALSRERPEVAFLLTSGYTGAEVDEQRAGETGLPFLPKPWTMDELLARVRAVLDRDDAAGR